MKGNKMFCWLFQIT